MSKTVIGVFKNSDQANEAVKVLREKGYDKEISVVSKNAQGKQTKQTGNQAGNQGFTMGSEDSVADGTATGGVIGGMAGLVAGAGALAIPGIGPIIAMGPISGLLAGAATGGIAGGLVDWGIPEEQGRQYEEDVKSGKILVALRTSENKVDDAAGILRKYGATNVGTH